MVTTVTDNSPQSINTSLFSLDKDIQEIKKVTDKLSGINPEANVISVNGKQGIVELNASDVNALPDTTVIPTTTSELENTSGFITINDVGASFVPLTRKVNDKQLNTDITLTASDVGALPDTTVIPTKTSELNNDSGFITSSGSITGNAATATTADKVANALTVNGKTYDGSSAVNAGVQTVANGGTGVTTQEDINKAFVGGLEEGESDVTDGTMFVSSYASDNGFADTNAVNVPYKRKFSRVWEYIKGKISSVLGLTANNYGGTADKANVPTGFNKIGVQELWGNQDGEFITDWETTQAEGADKGDISFRFNHGRLNIIIDGVFYQNEGKYKLVDENSIKNITKPNYTTGRFPAGAYTTGQTVSVSASITTTRGNPVFISYSGDYNSVNHGSTVPWISFELFVDGQIVQRTVVDDSVALESDNTPFAGNALVVLSAGEHTIRLDAVLRGEDSGRIQFQEQDNIVNLVAFEL